MSRDLGVGLPGTVVSLSSATSFGSFSPQSGRRAAELDPRTAQVLAAVLLASAEQVSKEKLATFGVTDAADLTMLALAMAFRGDDTGLLGDVFEWAVLGGINSGDPELSQMAADALTLVGYKTDNPQAILAAAEKGRLVEFSPSVPEGAKIMSGRRGRPRLVQNALAGANTRDWKADILLGAEDRWVTASLKSNPKDVVSSVRAAAAGPHPVRIGITPVSPTLAGLSRDPVCGAVLMRVPVDAMLMSLTRGVILDVKETFARHLSLPNNELARDFSGIGAQLHRWRESTVRQAVLTLREAAGGRYAVEVSAAAETISSADDLTDALISLDPLFQGRAGPAIFDQYGHERRASELLDFKPID